MNRRHGTQDGLRYIAQDRPDGGCEHAVWRTDLVGSYVAWMPHESCGKMEPFCGPDEVYESLTADSLHLWESDR